MSMAEPQEKTYSTCVDITNLFREEKFKEVLSVGKYTRNTLDAKNAFDVLSYGFTIANEDLPTFAEKFGKVCKRNSHIPRSNESSLPIKMTKKEIVRLLWQIGEFECRHYTGDTSRLKEPVLNDILSHPNMSGDYRYCLAATKLFTFFSKMNTAALGATGVLDGYL